MCRLYGFRANEPTKVECTLVRAQNALLIQSGGDLRGQTHPDGWGIARYENGLPTVERRATAAFADLHFSVAAERVYARTVVAHVRDATVGTPSIDNTHPFVHGRWVFAHNGTVRGVDRLEPELLREIGPELAAERRGSTDSELSFLWVLSRLRAEGIDLESVAGEPRRLAAALARAVRTLAKWSRSTGTGKQERLNFLLTDGHTMVVSRWHNGLYWTRREGVHDCEICGIPHVRHDCNVHYRAAVVASEPISHEEWREIPEASVLLIDPELEATVLPL
ncbi:MAG TPA: class II glutamine amidotransferase [Thermoanaerobaculia bacterium]|nr:class II glutamine amidotransferase [Thermoanaerobaculia bacterium]